MKYLVLRPVDDGRVRVTVEDGEREVELPFESWALCSFRHHRWVAVSMPALLRPFKTDGEDLYAVDFESAYRSVREALGPSDREGYESAVKSLRQARFRVVRHVLLFAWLAMLLAIHVMWGGLKLLLVMALLPLVVAVIKGR